MSDSLLTFIAALLFVSSLSVLAVLALRAARAWIGAVRAQEQDTHGQGVDQRHRLRPKAEEETE